MNQKYVFISYSSKQYAEATKVCIHLESKGIKCWMAPRNIQPGESYASQIVSAINNCDTLVLLSSIETNQSGHVSNEVNIAFDKKKTIIPFRLDNSDFTDELTYFLGRKHWINAFENFEKGLNLLSDTLLSLEHEEPLTLTPTVPTTGYNENNNNSSNYNNNNNNNNNYNNYNNNNSNSKYCTNCGSRMDASLPFCTNCGKSFQNHKQNSKFCTNCGSRMDASLPFCTNCGKSFNDGTKYYGQSFGSKANNNANSLQIITLIFMIISTIINAAITLFISLTWCIPMVLIYASTIKKNKKPGTGFKILTLFLIGLIPAICMFCDKD